MITAGGVRARIYVDNGSAFASKPLLREGASLGIRLAHSTPRRPEGRGKIERFFRTVRDQFLVELDTHHPPADLAELNRLFAAWVEGVHHRRVRSETAQTPFARVDVTAVGLPTPAEIHEAFLWSETRTSPRWRPCPRSAVTTKSTPRLLVNASSWCSTRSTSPGSTCASTGGRWAPRSPSTSAVMPTPQPAPTRRPSRASRPGINHLRLVETQRDRDLAAAGGIEFHQLALRDDLLPQPKEGSP